MTSEIRDLYGQLIDGMQGTRGQLRTGGDLAGAELQGSPPTQKPLALYSGITTVTPHSADQALATNKNSNLIKLTLESGLQRQLEALARDRAAALGPEISVGIVPVDTPPAM